MKYQTDSVRIFTLAGASRGRGLQCLATCPHCGCKHELRSKFYAIDYAKPDADLSAALRDLSRPSVCEACKTKSTFDSGCIRDELKQSAFDADYVKGDLTHAFRFRQYVSRESAQEYAQQLCVVVEGEIGVRSIAVWRLQTDSLSLELAAVKVLDVTLPAVRLSSVLQCGSCCIAQLAMSEAQLGWPGNHDKSRDINRSEFKPGVRQDWLELTTLYHAQFRKIGELLRNRLFKEYLCDACGVFGKVSATTRNDIRNWLAEHLTLEWVNDQMEILPSQQECLAIKALAAGSNWDEHLRRTFAQDLLLALHAPRDWSRQLEEFEVYARR